MNVLTQILEILKYIIPALVVFATVYYLIKSFFNAQYQLQALAQQAKSNKDIIPLKLQAYERLMMLCERIDLSALSYRLRIGTMNVEQFQNAMMIAVQQEYEHNLSQQIYVSESLWKIVNLAKNETLSQINIAGQGLSKEADSSQLIQKLNGIIANEDFQPLNKAKSAIKQEVSLILQ